MYLKNVKKILQNEKNKSKINFTIQKRIQQKCGRNFNEADWEKLEASSKLTDLN